MTYYPPDIVDNDAATLAEALVRHPLQRASTIPAILRRRA